MHICWNFSYVDIQMWNCWIVSVYLQEAIKLFSKVAVLFSIPTGMRILISPHFQHHLLSVFFFLAIVVGVVVPHCGFKLHLPNDLMMLSIFSCVYYLFLYFLWCKCLFKSFGHLFLNWIVFLFLSYMSYLYSLDMSRLSKDNNL